MHCNIQFLFYISRSLQFKCEQYWHDQLDKPYDAGRGFTLVTQRHRGFADYDVRDITLQCIRHNFSCMLQNSSLHLFTGLLPLLIPSLSLGSQTTLFLASLFAFLSMPHLSIHLMLSYTGPSLSSPLLSPPHSTRLLTSFVA